MRGWRIEGRVAERVVAGSSSVLARRLRKACGEMAELASRSQVGRLRRSESLGASEPFAMGVADQQIYGCRTVATGSPVRVSRQASPGCPSAAFACGGLSDRTPWRASTRTSGPELQSAAAVPVAESALPRRNPVAQLGCGRSMCSSTRRFLARSSFERLSAMGSVHPTQRRDLLLLNAATDEDPLHRIGAAQRRLLTVRLRASRVSVALHPDPIVQVLGEDVPLLRELLHGLVLRRMPNDRIVGACSSLPWGCPEAICTKGGWRLGSQAIHREGTGER